MSPLHLFLLIFKQFTVYGVNSEYYSFVTLATLGYGDIVPRSEAARGLAIMEAVAGQLYLAVLIARLVSLYVLGEDKGNQREAQDGADESTPC